MNKSLIILGVIVILIGVLVAATGGFGCASVSVNNRHWTELIQKILTAFIGGLLCSGGGVIIRIGRNKA